MKSLNIGDINQNGFSPLFMQHARTYQSEMESMCAELVRLPSVNGRDPETNVVDAIARRALAHNLYIKKFEFEAQRPALLIKATDEDLPSRGDGLLLVGHTDTVPEGDWEHWKHHPFEGQISDGKLFGRGAIDNKGGIVAAFFALVMLQDAGILELADCALVCVPDEEAGATGKLGIVPLLEQKLLRAKGAIYTYPGMEAILVGHRGVIRLSIETQGEAVHSGSRAWQQKKRGANAVTALCELLLEIEQMGIDGGTFPSNSLWTPLKGVVTPGTTISGGNGISIVPDQCIATVDIRTIPGQDLDTIITQVNTLMTTISNRRAGVIFNLTINSVAPPTDISVNTDIVIALQHSTKELLGKELPLHIAGPANEGYLLNQGGIPTICGFGPIGGNYHAPDEYIEVASLPTAAALYATTAVNLQNLTQLRK